MKERFINVGLSKDFFNMNDSKTLEDKSKNRQMKLPKT